LQIWVADAITSVDAVHGLSSLSSSFCLQAAVVATTSAVAVAVAITMIAAVVAN